MNTRVGNQSNFSNKSVENEHHQDMVKWTKAVALFTGLLFLANIATNYFIWKAQDDTKSQLRAFVGFESGRFIAFQDGAGKVVNYAFTPIFRNYGGTRTNSFSGWHSVHYFDKQVPNNLDTSKPYDKIAPSNIVIGPNLTTEFQPVTVTGDDGEKVLHHEGVILLWGHAEFTDIFDKGNVHHINFCTLWIPGDLVGGAHTLLPIPYKNECNSSD